MTIADKIVSIARGYIGQQELPGNSGFKDAEFLKKMKAIGWYPGASWCCFFYKLVWMEAYADEPDVLKLVKKYHNGSCHETYHNYRASPEFKVRDYPVLGAGVLFQHGKGPSGHAGVVPEIIGSYSFHSVEGNTNSTGGREGIEVYEQPNRRLHLPFSNGLNILGFVHPIEI